MLDSQNRLQNYFKNAKTTEFLLELAFYTSEGHTCKVLSFYDFWFTFNDKFCSPYPIVDLYAYLITKIGNRNLNSRTLDNNDAIQNHAIKSKIMWSSFSKEEIDKNCSIPLMNELGTLALDEYNRLACSSDAIINLLKKHGNPLARPICKNKTKDKVYFKLPPDVKDARFQGKIAFNAWKQSDFPSEGDVCFVYRSKHKEYRHKLREFLNQLEAFLVNDTLLIDRGKIRQMWADHFETLGTPSVNDNFDNNFCANIVDRVREAFDSCINNPSGDLCEPFVYEEVEAGCASLKAGISGVEIDYEHIRFAGPPLWKLLFQELYQDFL